MFFKRISGDVARSKAIIIFITHNIANTGGSRFSPAKMADCGNMLQYQAGTNMVITHRGKWELATGTHVGQVANWKIKTSAAGGVPNATAESWIRYGIGIDEPQEIAQVANEFGLIKKNGSWYDIITATQHKDDPVIKSFILKQKDTDPDSEESVAKLFKKQGMNKVTEFLTENEDIAQFIHDQIQEVMS